MTTAGRQLLAQIESHGAMLRASALDDDFVAPPPPELPSVPVLAPEDLEAASTLLVDLEHAEAHLAGLKIRLAGELAALRRPVRDSRRRAPRMIDTAI